MTSDDELDDEQGVVHDPSPKVLPTRRSQRGAVNYAVNKDVQLGSIKDLSNAPSMLKAERAWAERTALARRNAIRQQTEAGCLGERWALTWEASSPQSATRAKDELRARVYRHDDPDYEFHLAIVQRQIFVAIFPREGRTAQQNHFWLTEVEPTTRPKGRKQT
jgi:hypothetical protein